MLARRATFLLDADGIVQRVWDVTDAGTHPEDVLAAVSG
jgi:peroxiredoxin